MSMVFPDRSKFLGPVIPRKRRRRWEKAAAAHSSLFNWMRKIAAAISFIRIGRFAVFSGLLPSLTQMETEWDLGASVMKIMRVREIRLRVIRVTRIHELSGYSGY